MVHGVIFERLGADLGRSVSFDEHIDARTFVDVAMGRRGASAELEASVEASMEASVRASVEAPEADVVAPRPADVVLLDVNISESLNGLELAAQLQQASFDGLVCLMSGSAGDEVAAWRELAAIDLVFEKGAPIGDVVAEVLRAVGERRRRRPDELRVRVMP